MTESRLRFLTELFFTVAHNPGLSRSRISSLLSEKKSLVTLGKDLDILYRSGLITEKVSDSRKVGRNASLLFPTESKIAVLDLTKRDFTLKFCSFTGLCDRKLSHANSASLSFSENLLLFIQNAKSMLSSLENETVFGIAVVLPGHYDAENDRVISYSTDVFYSVAIGEIINDAFPSYPVVFCNGTIVTVSNAVREKGLPNTENTLFIGISEKITVASVIGGKIISGIAPITDPSLVNEITFSNSVRESSLMIRNALSLMLLNNVIIEIPKIYPCDAFKESVIGFLKAEYGLPESVMPVISVISDSESFSDKGAVRILLEETIPKKVLALLK